MGLMTLSDELIMVSGSNGCTDNRFSGSNGCIDDGLSGVIGCIDCGVSVTLGKAICGVSNWIHYFRVCVSMGYNVCGVCV